MLQPTRARIDGISLFSAAAFEQLFIYRGLSMDYFCAHCYRLAGVIDIRLTSLTTACDMRRARNNTA